MTAEEWFKAALFAIVAGVALYVLTFMFLLLGPTP